MACLSASICPLGQSFQIVCTGPRSPAGSQEAVLAHRFSLDELISKSNAVRSR